MRLDKLDEAVREHTGEFLCERIHEEKTTKIVCFAHAVEQPDKQTNVPVIERLNDFYDTFGSILFYRDDKTGDAGKYIAHPSQWSELQGDFSRWIEDLEEDEYSECVPEWVGTCLVIGETPHSGNYILVPTEGLESGHVFEFDHDGFEFTEKAQDVVEYVEKLLQPDSSLLTELAAHMRFVEDDSMAQWFIREMRDNGGRIVSTTA